MSEPTAAQRLLRANFSERLYRGPNGTPFVKPDFVAESGTSIYVVDIRTREEMVGPFGYIPGCVAVAPEQASRIGALGGDAVVVVVSNRAGRAATVASYLEMLGMKFVAVMEGGMAAWRALGLDTAHDPAGIRRTLAVTADDPVGPQAREPLTRARVEEHVGAMGSVRWIKMAGFLLRGRRSCVDGRDSHAVIGTPGGDMGEFVLSLAAYEDVTGARLTEKNVDVLMRDYVDTFGRVYYHNDTHTIGKLIPKLKDDPRLKPFVERLDGPLAWRTWLRGPPDETHDALLEHYLQTSSIGCGHLRLMMQHPDEYGLRAELVRDAVGAFWRTRWLGFPEFDYVILGGEHTEGAVLAVTVEERLWGFSRIPLVSPNIAGTQTFVFHSQVAAYIRQNFADWMLRTPLPVVPASRQALSERVVEAGHHQRRTTLGYLAKGLPTFEVRFADHKNFTVHEA